MYVRTYVGMCMYSRLEHCTKGYDLQPSSAQLGCFQPVSGVRRHGGERRNSMRVRVRVRVRIRVRVKVQVRVRVSMGKGEGECKHTYVCMG